MSRLTRGQEAEVGHVVGLVEDGDLDRVEAQVALAQVQVREAAGAGDDDVDARWPAADLHAPGGRLRRP